MKQKVRGSNSDQKGNKRSTYRQVVQALVSAGYLSDADIKATADVLEDALIVADAEGQQNAAADDYATQQNIVAEAEVWESEDASIGDYGAMEDDTEHNRRMRLVDLSKLDFGGDKAQAVPLDGVRREDIEDRTQDFGTK